jgi:hypothetical protein
VIEEIGGEEIVCVGHFPSSYPGFTLERDIVTAMAHFNFELD